MSEIGEEIERQISDAITAAVAEHEHGFVSRWVSLVEIIDDQGERAILTLASEDLRAWDSIGLLEFGLANERAALLVGRLQGD